MVLIHIFEAARRFYHMLFKIKSYITFLIGGISKYSVHSPFLHHFIQDVLDHRGNFYCFPAIELVRKKLSHNKRTIKKLDLGAGSSYGNKNEIPINQILKQEQSSPKKAKLLFKQKKYSQTIEILEKQNFESNELTSLQTKSEILAKSHDHLKNYEKAYKYFLSSNNLSGKENKYSADKNIFIKSVEDRIKFFSSFKTNPWKSAEIKDKKKDPIFLIGFPRSGTTLLDTILR